jgi:hypothetical protein
MLRVALRDVATAPTDCGLGRRDRNRRLRIRCRPGRGIHGNDGRGSHRRARCLADTRQDQHGADDGDQECNPLHTQYSRP